MKQKRTLESVADQTAEMWENGNPSKEIVDVIAKEAGGIVCDTPMREKAAGMYGIEAFHPFNLANVDVNVVRNLCRAIHDFGRSRFAAYKTVLMSEGIFSQEVRTAVWMDYVEMHRGSLRESGWLRSYIKLYVAMRAEGYQLIRNIHHEVIGYVKRRYMISKQLQQAIEDDDVAMFEMQRTIEGLHLTKTFMCDLLTNRNACPNGCPNIITSLIKASDEMTSVFPPDQMLLYVCSCGGWARNSVAAVRALVDRAPDCIHVLDPFGLTPVDYVFFNPQVDYERRVISRLTFAPGPKDPVPVYWNDLVHLLVQLGCDPDHKNKYGISSMDVMRMHQESLFLYDERRNGPSISKQPQWVRNERKSGLNKSFEELCKGMWQ